jgi:hypothetical protein
MRVLYVIFVVCVGALLWAAFAAARHIRRHEVKTANTQDPQKSAGLSDPVTEDRETVLSARDNRGD